MPTIAKPTKQDRAQLRALEEILTTARKWAIEEARALLMIRATKLYRPRYETFEQYTSQRWGIEKSQAYRLCEWATVLKTLSPIGEKPMREAHARPLYGLPPEQQRDIWREVVQRLGGQRTASEIEAVTSDVLRNAKPQKPRERKSATSGVIVCGDAIEQVRTLPKASIDLYLFSPPYCEQRNSHFPGIAEKDFPAWMARLLAAMRPSLTPRASIMIVGREHIRVGAITDAWLKARLAIRDIGFKEIDTLIWHKPDAPPLGRADRPRRTFEFAYWFSLSSSPYVDLRACSPEPSSPTTYIRRRGKNRGWHDNQAPIYKISKPARATDIITAPIGGNAKTGHAAPFPPLLADQLVRCYSPAGGMVADCCCGSGTTLAAAKEAGRDWWGADILPEWAEYSRKRLAV